MKGVVKMSNELAVIISVVVGFAVYLAIVCRPDFLKGIPIMGGGQSMPFLVLPAGIGALVGVFLYLALVYFWVLPKSFIL